MGESSNGRQILDKRNATIFDE